MLIDLVLVVMGTAYVFFLMVGLPLGLVKIWVDVRQSGWDQDRMEGNLFWSRGAQAMAFGLMVASLLRLCLPLGLIGVYLNHWLGFFMVLTGIAGMAFSHKYFGFNHLFKFKKIDDVNDFKPFHKWLIHDVKVPYDEIERLKQSVSREGKAIVQEKFAEVLSIRKELTRYDMLNLFLLEEQCK